MESNLNFTIYENNNEGKVLYIRHGQTNYNEDSTITNKEKIKPNPLYLDCELSSKGLSQAKETAVLLKTIILEKVYTSPFLRCLQTTYYALESHPNINNITVYVHPWLIEIGSGVHDMNLNTVQKKAKYNKTSKVKFDWSIFDMIYTSPLKQEMYYLEQCDRIDSSFDKLIKEAEELFTLNKDDKYRRKLGEIVQLGMDKGYPKLETLSNVFKRNIKFKEFLLNELNTTCDKDNSKKILVFTHSGFCKVATSKLAYSSDEMTDFPKDIYMLKNCELISIHINSDTCCMNKD